jgi:hypothetical protein
LRFRVTDSRFLGLLIEFRVQELGGRVKDSRFEV